MSELPENIRTARPNRYGRCWARRRVRARGEGGFTILETTIALSLLFVALTGTIATYAASVRGTVDGRERTRGVTVAREVVEQARAALYSQVGHDLGGDTGLAADPEVSSTLPRSYEGESLVGAPTPLYPQHRWTVEREASEFLVSVYVTWVAPGDADPFKRLTVVVVPQSLAASPLDKTVRISSYLFPAAVPPDPLLDGAVDVFGTTVKVNGQVGDVVVNQATVALPTAVGRLDSLFTRSTTGSARSSTALVGLGAGTLTGCQVSSGGTAAECAGIRADTVTDSDASTYHPMDDVDGPMYEGGFSVDAGAFALEVVGDDRVEAAGTARSCFSCVPQDIGDDDRLAYQSSEGQAAGGVDVLWAGGGLAGMLFTTDGMARSVAVLDQDAVSDSHKLSTSGRFSAPPADVVTVNGGPQGFAGAARVGAIDVTTSAQAGPTATAPSISSGTVSVDLYDTLPGGALGYRTLSLTPGEERDEEAFTTFLVGDVTVEIATTLSSGGRTVDSETGQAGIVTSAEASLSNWLRLEVRLLVTGSEGVLADLVIDVDYGRVSARTVYEAP